MKGAATSWCRNAVPRRVAAMAVAIAVAASPLVGGCLGEGAADIPGPEGGASKEGGSDAGAVGEGGKETGAHDGGSESDAGAGDGGKARDAVGATTSASLRVANLSPDSPAVDFCVAPQGTGAFQGPLLQVLAGSLQDGGLLADAATPGVALGQVLPAGGATTGQMVSAYVLVKPGSYDARIVVAGAVDCSTAIASATGVATVASAGFETIAMVGEAQPTAGAPPLKLLGLADDVLLAPPPDGGMAKLRLRFVNVALGVSSAVDFMVDKAKVFSAVSFGQAGAGVDGGASIDSHGYASMGALIGSKLSVLASGGASTQPLATGTISAAAGAAVTIVLVGLGSPAGSSSLRLVECVDNSATVGVFGACSLLAN